MLIDYRALLHRLITPRTGFTVVKLSSNDKVKLFTPSAETESKIILIDTGVYAIHLQPGDVIVQGSYSKVRKCFIINDLDELNAHCKIVQLDKSNNFYPLIDVPEGYNLCPVDTGLATISERLLTLINGVSNFKGLVVRPIQTIVPVIADDLSKLHKLKGNVSKNSFQLNESTYLDFNQSTGCLNVFTVKPEDSTQVELKDAKDKPFGLRLEIGNKSVSLVIDSEVFSLSKAIYSIYSTTLKSNKSTTTTTDAQSVKLD